MNSAPVQHTCPLCRNRLDPPHRLPPLSTMTLGELWSVVRFTAAAMVAMFIMYGVGFGLYYVFRAVTDSAEVPIAFSTPGWGTYALLGVGLLWLAWSDGLTHVVLTLARLGGEVGWYLGQVTPTRRVVLVGQIAAIVVAGMYWPWATFWFVNVVAGPVAYGLENWARERRERAHALSDQPA